MRYRRLGRTQWEVSEIGFGAWAIGGTGYGPTSDAESLRALETALDRGVNFFDTADVYGNGRSESLVAKFLKGKSRRGIFIATKAGWDFYHGGNRKNFDPGYLRFACEKSLARLDSETIDLYQLHNPSAELIRRGEILDALEGLKKEGKIRAIGISVHTPEEALAALEDGRADTLQLVYSLLDQEMGDEVFGAAKARGIGLIIREPLAYGFLSGKYKAGHVFHKDDHRRRFSAETVETNLRKIDEIKRVLSHHPHPLAQVALEYILRREEVSTVIPGAKTVEQVLINTEASAAPKLREEEARQLADLTRREAIFKEHVF